MASRPTRYSRRRESISSVDTADEYQSHYSFEQNVLTPHPKNQDSEDYTLFELKNAIVYGNDNSGSEQSILQNPLNVALKGPFTARGILVVEDKDQQRRVQLRSKQIPLEVRSVHRFSIALSNTGQPVVWILGHRGAWYEITPAPSFQTVYDDMDEAVKLWYCIVDFYQPKLGNHKKTKAGPRQDQLTRLLLQYAASAGDGCTYEQGIERMHKYSTFLFTKFLEEEIVVNSDDNDPDEVAWKDTEVFKWLKSKHPNEFRKIQSKPAAETTISSRDLKSHPLPPHLELSDPSRDVSLTPSRRTRKSRHSKSASVASLPVRNTGSASFEHEHADMDIDEKPKPFATQPAAVPSPAPISTERSVATGDDPLPTDPGFANLCYERLVEAMQEEATQVKKPEIFRFTTMANKIYFKFKFPEFKPERGTQKPPGSYAWSVFEILRWNAPTLLQDERLTQMMSGLPFWDDLQKKSKERFEPVVLGISDFPFLLVPRKKKEPRISATAPVPTGTPKHAPPAVLSTPRGPLYGETAGPSGKRPRGRPMESVLRIAPSSRKRPYSATEYVDDDEIDNDASHHFGDDDETIEVLTNDEHSALDQSNNPVHLADETPMATDKAVADAFKVAIRSETGVTGQDGWVLTSEDVMMWKCKENECGFLVRGAADEDDKERVAEHLKEHAKKNEMAALVWAEKRAHLPVDHLLQKIMEQRERVEKEKQEKEQRENGDVVPIKRRLFT